MAGTGMRKHGDALDALADADHAAAVLLDDWREATETLAEGDDSRLRWERGSAVKLLVQQLAVRESAKSAVAQGLEDVDPDLADRIRGDGPGRRRQLDRLDEVIRGCQAMALNGPDVNNIVGELDRELTPDLAEESDELIPAARRALGDASSDRELTGRRRVQMTSDVHPSPEVRWYDRVWPLKAVKSLYTSLRTSPRGGTSPSLDPGREHTPGPRR